jgi:hypothetical protein
VVAPIVSLQARQQLFRPNAGGTGARIDRRAAGLQARSWGHWSVRQHRNAPASTGAHPASTEHIWETDIRRRVQPWSIITGTHPSARLVAVADDLNQFIGAA